MPTYAFQHNETDEIIEKFMSYSDKLKFLENNPQYQSIISSPPGIVTGVNHNSKMDEGWKENLHRIAEAHPHSALADKMGNRSAKQVKVEQLAEKHNVKVKSDSDRGSTAMPFEEEKYFYDQQK